MQQNQYNSLLQNLTKSVMEVTAAKEQWQQEIAKQAKSITTEKQLQKCNIIYFKFIFIFLFIAQSDSRQVIKEKRKKGQELKKLHTKKLNISLIFNSTYNFELF